MRVPSELILKPGAILKVEKIDFNNPEVKRQIQEHHNEIKKLKRIKVYRYGKYGTKRI